MRRTCSRFATLACLPARIPVELGDEDANLLLPLYVVVASLAVALGWQLVVRRDTRSRELGPLALPLAAFVAWTGLTLLWSVDLREGAIFVGAFVLPFGLLAVGFARLPWRGRLITWLWVALVGTALAYASVGVYQWATREVFWNPKVIVGNAYAPFFRVNSIFWDPSIYGRYLDGRDPHGARGDPPRRGHGAGSSPGSTPSSAAMWVGLFFSFSQSSFVALAVGRARRARSSSGDARRSSSPSSLAVVVALGSLAVAGGARPGRDEVALRARLGHERPRDPRRAGCSGSPSRTPSRGVGVGRLQARVRRADGAAGQATEEGCVAYDARDGGGGGGACRGSSSSAGCSSRRSLAALRGLGRGFTSRVSFAVGLTLVAIIVHSFFYNALFEDPMTWAHVRPRRPRRQRAAQSRGGTSA